MNLALDRSFVAQAAIMIAVGIGAWMTLVQPVAQELAQLRRTISEDVGAPTLATQPKLEDLAESMKALHARVDQIETFNALADDSSRLYGLFMDRAQAHGVQVLSLQPGAEQGKDEDAAVKITRIDVLVEGAYEGVAAFLKSLETIEAFVRPHALQLSPTQNDGANSVNARFECDILRFKVPEALDTTGAIANGQP